VEKVGADGIQINGLKNTNGTVDGVKSLTNTVTNWLGLTAVPTAAGTGQVTVTNN
jgi:hypothetical protein